MASYFFPNINIAFTPIPKTGITTLKDYLYKLEMLAAGAMRTNSLTIENSGANIHRNKELDKYLVDDIDSIQLGRPIRILALRNPYRRALSAWTNKFLLVPSDGYMYKRYREEDFVPKSFNSIREINHCFEKFTQRLAQDEGFRAENTHWRPQSSFVSEATEWDYVVETSQLDSLGKFLTQHLRPGLLEQAGEIPQLNDTANHVKALLGSDLAWSQVEKGYQSDFSLMHKFKLDTMKPAVNSASENQAETLLISNIRLTVERNLARIELKQLEAQISKHKNKIDQIYDSKTWRYTALARWLFSLFGERHKPNA